jgi:predicted nucleic acid-binding protein
MAMAGTPITYVLDTSVFIQAFRQYYPFDICLGFWDCLLHHARSSRLVSIDRVHEEIRAGNDKLKEWATKSAPPPFFASTSNPAVVTQFSAMMRWVQDQSQFKQEAKAEFADVADGWVAAYAKAYKLTLVTQEVFAAEAKKKVPLPNVCVAFSVPCISTYDLLRALDVHFTWSLPH